MKDAVLTIRVPRAKRRRIEELARREGRSLSAQVERLLDQAMAPASASAGRPQATRELAGTLRGGRTPTLEDFRTARGLLSAALRGRTGRDARARR